MIAIKEKCIILLLFSVLAITGHSQYWSSNGFQVGDTVPDVNLENVINYKYSDIRLSSLKGKVVIFDFWNKWCASCIAGFPKMQKLQDEFGDKLQVFLVTDNSWVDLEKLFETSPIFKTTRLPFIIGDTVLGKIFPHGVVPYHVWVKDQKVIATTEAYNATREHVNSVINGEKVNFSKRKQLINFNYQNPLLIEGNGRLLHNLKYYSLIMGPIEVPKNGYRSIRDSITGKTIGITMQNLPIGFMYTIAYGSRNFDKILIEAKNPDVYFFPNDKNEWDPWAKDHTYCYEVELPPDRIHLLHKIMKQDLDRFFGLSSYIEKRKIKCIVLYPQGTVDRLKTKGAIDNPEQPYIFENSIFGLIIRNIPFKSVVNYLKGLYSNNNSPYLVDEVNYKGNVDMDFKSDISDFSNLIKELEKYDIGVKVEYRLLKVLILKENYINN